MKILILKPSSLGDVIQALPVLRMIRLHLPDSEIFWWVDVRNAAILEDDPDLTGIVRFERERWESPLHWNEIWSSVGELRRHRFDWVIDLQSLARSATIAWLANGRFTIGLQDWRELAPAFYDASVPRPSPLTHAVDWYLGVLPPLGVPVRWDFEWLPKRQNIAEQIDALWSVNGKRWIAVQPGARWENKRWPTEYFAQTIAELHRSETDFRFVVLGSASDRLLGEMIANAAPAAVLNVCGETSLWQMIEWIRASELMLTNDTGPMHVAAALRKPIVGIFGPTNPARTGPYGQVSHAIQNRALPCVPCLKDSCSYEQPLACLRTITPAQVVAEVQRRLRTRPESVGFGP